MMPGGTVYHTDPDVPVPAALHRPPDVLMLWVIYDHPKDAPRHYVLRPQFAGPGGQIVPVDAAWASSDPELLRELLRPLGLTNLGRHEDDDAKILEVWV